jgi:hypothetical protein
LAAVLADGECDATPFGSRFYYPEKQRQTTSTLVAVRSKLKCPLFIASEMSGFGFWFTHKP